MPAGHVIGVALVALLIGAVLNAPALSAAADSRPFGWKRTAAVVAVAPIKGIASVLRLDRPHRALAAAAAQARGEETAVASAETAVPPPPATADDTPSVNEGALSPATAPNKTEAGPTDRTITAKRPLRLWVGGDSLASEFGPALAERVTRTGRARGDVDFRYSTGLTRPDFFNWPSQLEGVTEADNPDVFVVIFGANDAQDLSVSGKVISFATPEWIQTYGARVGELMDDLATDGRSVYWVGQPIMRSESFDARMKLLNTIYQEEAAKRSDDGVHYIDTRQLFAIKGRYTPYLPDAEGQATLMRQQDGIHLTTAGGQRLANVVFDTISKDWPLRAAN